MQALTLLAFKPLRNMVIFGLSEICRGAMRGIRSAPTLEDVAKSAGVSTATVSRCLNTPERLVESTRERVMKAVEQLGYTPNFGARVMAAKRTFTIGAIIPTMENAIFARGLQAFQEELHRRGFTLLVSSSAYQPDVEEEQIRTLVSRGADGLLLIGYDRDASIYDYLESQEVPSIVAWTYQATAQRPSVGFENRASMRDLTQEVLRLGHSKIGVISGVRNGNDRARERVEGIEEALVSKGFATDKMKVVETYYDVECGARAFDELMDQKERPTAVICGNDVLAAGALRQARERGFDVPGDVSITGFDDIELSRIVVPALTTVHVPHREMGRIAARELADMVEGKSSGTSTKLQAELRLRESLGPASK
jgi:LacI family transcriptional regulator